MAASGNEAGAIISFLEFPYLRSRLSFTVSCLFAHSCLSETMPLPSLQALLADHALDHFAPICKARATWLPRSC